MPTIEHMLVAFITQQVNFNTLLLEQLVRSEVLTAEQVQEIADGLTELDKQDPARSLTYMAEAIRGVTAPDRGPPPHPKLRLVKG